MKDIERRLTGTLALFGGLLAAALLSATTASADEVDFGPDANTFVPTQVEGFPPLIGNELFGTETWVINDLSTGKELGAPLEGGDTQFALAGFTNDDFVYSGSEVSLFDPLVNNGLGPFFDVPTGSQFDLANFGGGFENAWMDIVAGPNAGVSDLLITPFGDFTLFGTGFADLAATFAIEPG